jgi:glycosyltransferase EpsF
MKRILHVIGGMNRAGAETMIMNIYRAVDKTKFQFDFLVYSDAKQDYEDEIVALGGRVIHMPMAAGTLGLLKSVKKIRCILKSYGPYCAVHAATLHNSAFALIAAIGIKHCKKIVHSHSTQNVLNPNLITKLYNFITKKIIRTLGQEFIACGEEAGIYLFGEKLFKRSGVVINNSVDIDSFYDVSHSNITQTKSEFGITNELVIGSVARFVEVKNHERMLKIAAELKRKNVRFKMLLIGRGDLEADMRKLSSDLGLDNVVLFLGVRSDIPLLMHVMDVFLMPSHFEGNPVTLIEAQTACLPSVISDIITPKIDLGLNLISRVSLADSDAVWADAIIRIKRPVIDKTQLIDTLSKAGYELNANVKRLCDLYVK